MKIPTWQERRYGGPGIKLRPYDGDIESAMQDEIDDCRKEITRLENKYEKGTDIELPMSRDPMYNVWRAIISRCTNEKDPGYKNYGGRGVKICDSWMKDFYKFKTDVGFPPNTSVNMSLDRIDTCGNYEPENIRWSDSFTQNRNTRVQSNNTTGHKGVSNFNGRYRASISVSGKFISLGVFDTIAEAVAARQEGEVFHWGDSDKTKCGLSVRVGISDFDEESRKEHDALRAENAELRAALAQPCKYNQAAETCTLAPMDCQCAIDAAMAQAQGEAQHVGDTRFEGWLSEYKIFGATGYIKQDMRNSYWAGFSERTTHPQASEPAPASGEREALMARLQNVPRLDDVRALVDLMEAAKDAADMLAADEADKRPLRYRIHELEGEVIGYKRILAADAPAPAVWTEAQALGILSHFGDGPFGHDDVDAMVTMLSYIETLRPDFAFAKPAQQVAVPQGEALVEVITGCIHRHCATPLIPSRVHAAAREIVDKYAAAPQPPQAATPTPCAWTEDADGYYSTECGECFAFNEGTPAQNKAYFCHHCGGKIEVAA